MAKPNLISVLKTHIKAKYSVIALQTAEENRAVKIISEIAEGERGFNPRRLYTGSITKGLTLIRGNDKTDVKKEGEQPPEEEISGSITEPLDLLNGIEKLISPRKSPATIFVLLDMHEAIDKDPEFRRKLRDLHTLLKTKFSTIILISPSIDIHSDLQKTITVFDLPLPDKSELGTILDIRIQNLKTQVKNKRDGIKKATIDHDDQKIAKLTTELEGLIPICERVTQQANENRDLIVSALQGLTANEADEVLAKCIVTNDLTIETILGEKQQVVKKNKTLDYLQSTETQETIGGLNLLKKWARSANNRFSEKARKYGLKPPKGLLLIGAPGTGKTLSAKALANLFNIPLLTLSMAQMTSKYYGETGNRMTEALKFAQAMSPCIVLIDEIDKAFGTVDNQEHEESARTRGALLTAMEESEGIFWLGTCNQPERLAPELQARFPVIFHVDLPSREERREIFAVHLKKIGRDPAKFDMDQLILSSNGYVGREIRNALQEALGSAFDEDTALRIGDPATTKSVELNTDHIIESLKKITPTATQRKAEIGRIRAWCKQNAQPASEPEESTAASIATATKEELMNQELEIGT